MEDPLPFLLEMHSDLTHEEVLLVSDTGTDKSLLLSVLGNVLIRRFERVGDLADIDKAILVQDDAVRLTPDDDDDKPLYLNNLGNSFQTRFERLGDIADIEKAISAKEDAIRLTPENNPNKPIYLNNLGISFQTRFEHLGDITDIEKALSAKENAMQLMPDDHPDRPPCLDSLGISYQTRFEHIGDLEDLQKAISAMEDAVRLTTDNHPNKPVFLNSLGISYHTRFEHIGGLEDLQKAISAKEDAIRLTPDNHPNNPVFLNNLGVSFQTRYERTGDITDIEKAVSAEEDAVRLTPDGGLEKPGRLTNLGVSFQARFERLGDIMDIERAISAQEDAVKLVPAGHADQPACLTNLGNSFYSRFERLGDISNIDRAISAHDNAVRLTTDEHPNKPIYLNNLGNAFQTRFGRLGDIADIDRAIAAQDDAVRLTSGGHPDKPMYLSNLGNSCQARFGRLEDIADINKAISALDNAAKITPDDHPDKPAYLNNLCAAFGNRFKRVGDVTGIDEAILVQENAVQLTPDGHPDKPIYLNNLGNSFENRFECLGDVADIDRAISAQDDAVRLTPDGHPEKPGRLTNLGISFQTRFDRLGDIADINKAMLQFSSAARCSVGPALHRFRAALRWATCALKNEHSSRLDAYHRALELLPQVAWLGLPMAEQHRELTGIGDVARDAAAAAIASGKYETALEWLEQGRSVVWGQILHLRTPVDDLRAAAPTLADRLMQVSAHLERASTRDNVVQASQPLSLEEIGRNHRELALEWESLVERARAVPGFKDFLRPKTLSQLRSAARSGPVVVINVHKDRCDALILMADQDKPIHIPLERLSYGRVQALQRSMEVLLSNAGVRVRCERGTTRVATQFDGTFGGILSELWMCVAKPVLDSLAFPEPRTFEPPHLWWCPTGPLTFLPLHAAGLYQTNEPGTKVTDFVVSSYTPTLAALIESPRAPQPLEFQLLAITQPSTPGHSSLPNTEEELKRIRKRVGSHPLMSLEGREATVEHVIRGMTESSWVHLACHGTQNAADPTKSALILQDGYLELSKIIRMSLPHADFAFLSACQTATGDKHLTEEAVHLAAGMLLAGYRGVIATTWSIKDNDAPLVADEVYSRLFEDGHPDYTQAAHALHHAVQRLRDQGAPFVSWVPFIHIGL